MNVGCSWPGKCRCLRKMTLMPEHSSVVPTQAALQRCWNAAERPRCAKTVCRLIKINLITRDVHRCLRDSPSWQFDVILSSQCCSRPPRGPAACHGQVGVPGLGTDYSAFWSSARCSSTLLRSLKQPTHYLCFVSAAVPVFGCCDPAQR